jgi:dTDP-4-dehydrorhamnose reductase
MTPIILLTGRTGQIGSELLRLLPDVGEVFAPGREELDLLKPGSIRQVVRKIRPHLIVNAAAHTAVDAAETDQAAASAVNADGPAVLAEEAKAIGAALVHYSTDYVFDGRKAAPYDEADPTNPLNVYGKTKFAGEQAIRSSGVPHLTFRTSWVYATRGSNFLLTILRLATEREELKIVSDQTGSPTHAAHVAAVTARILASLYQERSDAHGVAKVAGTYHMTAGGETTWFGFAQAILELALSAPEPTPWLAAATRARPLKTPRVLPITTQEYRSPASRPAYSVLSNRLLTQTFAVELPGWRDQLQHCFSSECSQHDGTKFTSSQMK